MKTKHLPIRVILLLAVLGMAQLFCGQSEQATTPPEQPAMMLIVPVGATVVQVALRIGR